MLKTKLVLSTLTILLLMGCAYANAGLEISPGTIDATNAHLGQSFSTNINIINTGTHTLNINITSARLLKSDNSLVIESGGIANMITASPSTFTLLPHSQKTVKVTVSLNPNYKVLDAFGGIIVTGDDIQAKTGNGVSIKNNIALVVPISVGIIGVVDEKLNITHNIQGLLLSAIPGGLAFNFNNTGNVKENITDKSTLFGFLEDNKTINVGNSTLYPGDTKLLKTTWTPGFFDMGFYTITNTVNYGREATTKTAVNKQTVFVFPIWLLFLIIFILLVYGIRRSGFKAPIEIKRRK